MLDLSVKRRSAHDLGLCVSSNEGLHDFYRECPYNINAWPVPRDLGKDRLIDYDPHIWRDHLLDFRGSVTSQSSSPRLIVTVWSILVGWFHTTFNGECSVDRSRPRWISSRFAVGVSDNASYDRFWEGRRQWGSIINASRNLSRGFDSAMRDVPDLGEKVRKWTAGFAHAVMHRLRDKASLGEAASYLPADHVTQCESTENVPLAASVRISLAIADARRCNGADRARADVNGTLKCSIDRCGWCLRPISIVTPLPFAYVVHLQSRPIDLLLDSTIRHFRWLRLGNKLPCRH